MDQDTALGAAIAQIAAGVVALRAATEGLLDDAAVVAGVREVDALITSTQHAWLGLVAELDHRPGAVPGARAGLVARSFLRGGLNRTAGQARKDVAAAKALEADSLPGVAAAMEAGEISRDSLDVAIDTLDRVPKAVLGVVGENGTTGRERLDCFLAEHAKEFDPRQLRRLGTHLVSVLDPGSMDKGFDPESWRRRYLHLIDCGDGTVLLRGQLDAASAVWLKAALGHLGAPQRIDTCGPAGEKPGEKPGLTEEQDGQEDLGLRDERSTGQRNLDALVTMSRHVMQGGTSGTTRREPAHLLVLATPQQLADAHTRPHARLRRVQEEARWRQEAEAAWSRTAAPDPARAEQPQPEQPGPEQLEPPPAPPPEPQRFNRAVGLAEVARTGPVKPDVLALITCDALLQAVVLGGAGPGRTLELGRTQRTANRAQRRALTARDGGCIVPGCEVPASDTDAHHVIAWAAGGPTDLANLVLLCPRHHAEVHLGIWTLVDHDGLPHAIPPDWHLLHDRPPRRTRHSINQAQRLAQQLRLDLDPPDAPAA